MIVYDKNLSKFLEGQGKLHTYTGYGRPPILRTSTVFMTLVLAKLLLRTTWWVCTGNAHQESVDAEMEVESSGDLQPSRSRRAGLVVRTRSQAERRFRRRDAAKVEIPESNDCRTEAGAPHDEGLVKWKTNITRAKKPCKKLQGSSTVLSAISQLVGTCSVTEDDTCAFEKPLRHLCPFADYHTTIRDSGLCSKVAFHRDAIGLNHVTIIFCMSIKTILPPTLRLIYLEYQRMDGTAGLGRSYIPSRKTSKSVKFTNTHQKF